MHLALNVLVENPLRDALFGDHISQPLTQMAISQNSILLFLNKIEHSIKQVGNACFPFSWALERRKAMSRKGLLKGS